MATKKQIFSENHLTNGAKVFKKLIQPVEWLLTRTELWGRMPNHPASLAYWEASDGSQRFTPFPLSKYEPLHICRRVVSSKTNALFNEFSGQRTSNGSRGSVTSSLPLRPGQHSKVSLKSVGGEAREGYKIGKGKWCLCLLLLLFAVAAHGQGLPSPVPCPQFFSASGTPLAGGFLYSYTSGTLTPQATYTDYTLNTANSNPITLNAGGFPVSVTGSCGIFLNPSQTYRFVLQNSSGVQQFLVDGITTSNLSTILSQPNTWTALQTFSGGITSTGTFTSAGLNAQNIAGVLHADQFSGADLYAQIAAAITALAGNPGVIDASNYTTNQTITSGNLTIAVSGVTIILPPVTIFEGANQIIIPVGVNNVSLGCNTKLSTNLGCIINYTGSSYAMTVGANSALTNNFKANDFSITLGSSAVGGIWAKRTLFARYDNVAITGAASPNSQICFNSDGTGSFSAYTMLLQPNITGCHTAAQFIGPGGGNNANEVIGGTLQASGQTDTGSTCLLFNTGDSNDSYAADLENCDIGVQFGANAQFSRETAMRFEGATINTAVKFIAGSGSINVQTIDAPISAITVSNACGITCSVDLAGSFGSDGTTNNNIYQINGNDASMYYTLVAGKTADQIEGFRFFTHTQGAAGSLYQDASDNIFLASGNGTTNHFVARPGTSTDINAPSGDPIRFNVSSGNGYQFFNSGGSFSGNVTPTLTASRVWNWPDGPAAMVMPTNFSTSSGTSDNVAVQGMTASGHCSLTATNSSAATNIATTYVSAKTTNQITVTHTGTSGMNYDIFCTAN